MIRVPGRTRWTAFDATSNAFYVNIADPAQIVVVSAEAPTEIARTFSVPAAGPHGLDIDAASRRLFCACDSAKLVTLDLKSGNVLTMADISGTPDVIFFNPVLQHLYVAVGDPGVIDVFDTRGLKRIGQVQTERGAHTTALCLASDRLYAFLPLTHRAAIYEPG